MGSLSILAFLRLACSSKQSSWSWSSSQPGAAGAAAGEAVVEGTGDSELLFAVRVKGAPCCCCCAIETLLLVLQELLLLLVLLELLLLLLKLELLAWLLLCKWTRGECGGCCSWLEW